MPRTIPFYASNQPSKIDRIVVSGTEKGNSHENGYNNIQTEKMFVFNALFHLNLALLKSLMISCCVKEYILALSSPQISKILSSKHLLGRIFLI